ncbi:ABC transporter ATP-binding protein [Thalassobacillus hwangdonensis]|uniref:ABC transporter ATP-binding protein n=1 Tax=Thalassobacillus hwangdonensis TaxID=546108 RepID=A0ABW3L457_9BACI
MNEVINLHNVAHSFGKEVVLDNVDLSVKNGEIFGLLGPSGAGKTTLVKIITGILSPTRGTSTVQGTIMPSLQQMRKIGFMAQSDALYTELSGRENLDFFASIYEMKKTERKNAIQKFGAVVDLLDHLDKRVENYSGGMKRRLSLAAALLHEPDVLILDEPTVGIDPILRQSIWNELYRLKESGKTIIVTTHVMDEAEKCDRLALLRDGSIIAQGTPNDLKHNVQVDSIEEAFLQYGGAGK